MIANSAELKVAARNLRILEDALLALRNQLEATNAQLFEVTSKAYVRRINSLQTDIAKYLSEHPQEVSLILPSVEQFVTASASPLTPTA